MNDLDHRFRTDCDQSGDRTEPEATTEDKADWEGVGGPSAATNAMPASADQPDVSLTPLAPPEGKQEPSLPVEAAATTKINQICFDERPPDFDLLIHQMVGSVAYGGLDPHKETAEKLEDGAVALYLSLKPQDAVESVLGRLIVAGTNASMDSFGRAAQCDESLRARDLNLRLGFKGSAVVCDLLRFWESRRGRGGSNVKVGEVNVAAGGQAIVGTVQSGERRPQTQTPGSPAVTKKNDG